MKNLDEVYEELKISSNKDLDILWGKVKNERKKSNKIVLITCLIIDMVFIYFSYPNMAGGSFKFGSDIVSILLFVLPILVINIFIYVIITGIFSKNQTKFKQMYKLTVIKKIMENFYTNLEYFPQKHMPEYIYNEGCFNEYYNKYYSEDYLEAQINNKYSLQMAEIETQREETHKDSDGNIKETTTTVFHGLFAKIIMEKSINSKIKVMQNGKMFLQNNKLKMDSSVFEKYFDVQASNKIIAMQLLTADIMEDLIEFQNKTNVKYDISIENNNLYLRFHLGDVFELTNTKSSPLEKESIKKYFYILNFTYNLSNKIIKLIEETEI